MAFVKVECLLSTHNINAKYKCQRKMIDVLSFNVKIKNNHESQRKEIIHSKK